MQRIFASAAVLSVIALGITGCSTPAPVSSPTVTQAFEVNQQARALLPDSIKKSGVLRVASDLTYPPNEFTNANKEAVGWEIDLIRKVADRLSLSVKVINTHFADIFPTLNGNNADVGLSSFFDTAERRKQVDMVDYYQAGTKWAALKGSNLDPSNACGYSIAVQKSTYQSDVDLPARSQACQKQNRKPIQILGLNTQDEATEAVMLGQAKAFVADSTVTDFAVMRSNGKLITVGDVYDTSFYGMPVAKGSSLGKALEMVIQDLMNKDVYREVLSSWGVTDGAIGNARLNGQ